MGMSLKTNVKAKSTRHVESVLLVAFHQDEPLTSKEESALLLVWDLVLQV